MNDLRTYMLNYLDIAKKINTKEEVEELCADLLMENNELQEITLSGPSYSLEACKVISNMIGKYTTLEVYIYIYIYLES